VRGVLSGDMSVHPNVTLRQMRAFVEVYRLRNLTHAAKAMHMTQSAMSVLIQQFEEGLGIKLFERTPRALRPTKAADDAYLKVEGIMRDVVALGQDMRERAGESDSVLAFSCAPLLFSGIVPTALAEFKRTHPNLKTVMYDAIGRSLIETVLDQRVEFSIGFFENEPEAVTGVPLIEDYLCAVCAKGSALAGKSRVTWEDIAELPLINLSRAVQLQQLIVTTFAGMGHAYRPAYEMSFIQTALAVAAQDLGVVMIPGYLARNSSHDEVLVAKKLHDPAIERSLLYHTRQGHTLSRIAAEFLDLLRQRILRHG
jgi:DNA-binding transcriptional LysR family regulator